MNFCLSLLEKNTLVIRLTQVPNNKDRHQRKGEITHDVQGRVEKSKVDNDFDGDAVSINVLVPKVGYRRTLKHGHKKEDEASDDAEEHGEIDKPSGQILDENSQQEQANGDFGKDHGPAVTKVAKEPELCCPTVLVFFFLSSFRPEFPGKEKRKREPGVQD